MCINQVKYSVTWCDDQVAATVLGVANASSRRQQLRLHVPVDSASWMTEKLARFDALFGLGIMRHVVRHLVMRTASTTGTSASQK